MKRLFSVLFFLALLPSLLAFAYDWGLSFNQNASVEGVKDEDSLFTYTGTLSPWLSASLGANARFYFSASGTIKYSDKNTIFIPELLRTELALLTGAGGELKVGRILYADPLGFIAAGLFDGARFSFGSSFGGIGAGIFYTGLLYKKGANIIMTADDLASSYAELDYANFADTYFAPRRLIAALDWENPYLKEWLRLKVSLIGQFDLTGADELCHSQYLAFKGVIPVQSFVVDIGACMELAEISKEFNVSLAGELGIGWMLPTPLIDMLKLTWRFSTGDGSFTPFIPITTVTQGGVLQAKLSGISMICVDYTARLHETFSIILSSSYFILSDKNTYQGLPEGRDGRLLGNEFFGRLIWSPFSDLQLNFGGGVFLPSMGNTGSTRGPLWRVELNALLAIF